ncbi:MAG TPA: ATP-binding protein, partial [Gemmatimonadaceae bacterium]
AAVTSSAADSVESSAAPVNETRAGMFMAPGEMAERCRAFDWAATPLGPVERWSQSLRTMADAVLASRNPMLLFWGPDLIQIYNDAFRPSFGAAEGPDARHPRALGMRAADFWTDVWSVVGPQIDGVMTRGEAVWFEDLHLPIERNGRLDDAWWTYSYSPVRDDDGRISGTLVVCIETTSSVVAKRELIAQRVRVEEMLESMAQAYAAAEKARASAELANRAKADFLAVMSHELRTPLNAIGGYAELIDIGVHGPVTAEQREALEKIQRSQRHLLGLINGVLNYAKIDAGAVQYDLEDFPLREILATCEALVAPQMRRDRLTFHNAAVNSPVCVRADREKVQQVLINLLTNAIKFTDAGGVVRVECELIDGGHVGVRVSDTGRGIPADRLATIFDPFVQVDANLTRTQQGVGLGLAIGRDLARGMGGDLTVSSTPGRGSTFTLVLPAAAES